MNMILPWYCHHDITAIGYYGNIVFLEMELL